MTARELVVEMRALWVEHSPRMNYGTHYVGCHTVHAACAIERLCQEIDALLMGQSDEPHGSSARDGVE